MHFHCTICREQGNLWQDLGNVCVAKCGHTFHLKCLMPHISSQSKSTINCPASRSDRWSKCDKKIQLATIIQIDPIIIETQKNNTNNINCNFCEKRVTDPKNIGITKCGHIYHYDECLTNLVRLKSNPCMAPLCQMKTTQGTIAKIHLVLGASDVTQSSSASTVRDETPCPQKNEQKPDVSPVLSCKKERKPIIIPIPVNSGVNHGIPHDVKEESAQTPVVNPVPPLSQENKDFEQKPDVSPVLSCKKERKPIIIPIPVNSGVNHGIPRDVKEESAQTPVVNPVPPLSQENKDFEQLIKLRLERNRWINILDEEHNIKKNNTDHSKKFEKQYETLKEQMKALEKELNDAKKETKIWEMTFGHLQDKFKDTEMMIPNEKTLNLIKENEKLKMHPSEMEKELNDAKKETKIWEMAFGYLQEKFKDTEMMIPNEKTLDILKENEKLKMHALELERERNYAKKETEIWEMSFKYLQDNFNDSEIMIPNDKTLKLIKENEKLKKSVQDLESKATTASVDLSQVNEQLLEMNKLREHKKEMHQIIQTLERIAATAVADLGQANEQLLEMNKLREHNEQMQETIHTLQSKATTASVDLSQANEQLLEMNKLREHNENMQQMIHTLQRERVSVKKEDKSSTSLREDLENYIEENLNLTTDNENMKRDLKSVRENLNELELIVNNIVTSHSLETNTLQEFSNTLLNENTRLKESFVSLQAENNALNDMEKKEDNNKLKEPNQFLRNEITRLSELFNTLQEDNNKLKEPNQSLLDENTRLSELNNTLQEDNNKLEEPNQSLLEEITRLSELNNTLQEDNNKLKEPNQSLLDEITRLSELNNTLQEDNNKLKEPNQTLLDENTRLSELNNTLQEDNNKLKEPNQSLLEEITRLSELNNTLQEDNNKLKEPNQSLLEEITRLSELNNTLQEDNNKLKEPNQSLLDENTRLSEFNNTLQEDNNKLKEPNQSLLEEITRLSELNNTLQEDNNKLKEPNQSLLDENTRLSELNNALQEDNNKLKEPNQSLLEEITRLSELNNTLQEDNNKLKEPNQSLLEEITRLSELNNALQKEKRDFKWEVLTSRFCANSSQITKHENEATVKEEVVKEAAVNENGTKRKKLT